MYELSYFNITDIVFYPIVNSFSITRSRKEENPFIIRELATASFSVSETDFDFFVQYKGTSSEIEGTFTESVGVNSKIYDCIFTVSENINYDTKMLEISMTIKDKYYFLLDSPLKNITTNYDLIEVLGVDTKTVETSNFSVAKQHVGSYLFSDILEYIINDIDSSIIINTNTYQFFVDNGYESILIDTMSNFSTDLQSEIDEIFDFSLSDILDFFSFNSGMQLYFYLNESNELIFKQIDNLVEETLGIDLTNYNNVDWTIQKQSVVSFEDKKSLLNYNNNFENSVFRNVNFIFDKNKKNEETNEYLFVVDSNIRKNKLTEGNIILNCDSNNVDEQGLYTNNSLTTFTSSSDGSTLTGTTENSFPTYASRYLGAFVQGEKIVLKWDAVGGNDAKIQIYSSTTGLGIDIDINDNYFYYFVESDRNIEIRIYLDGTVNPSFFNITNFEVYREKYINKILSNINNYTFSPVYLIDNFGGNFPNTEGILNGSYKIDLNKKPSEVENIDFPFSDLIDNFDFSKYVKTSISEEMIPYKIERQILDLDNKGFDKLTLKKR